MFDRTTALPKPTTATTTTTRAAIACDRIDASMPTSLEGLGVRRGVLGVLVQTKSDDPHAHAYV